MYPAGELNFFADIGTAELSASVSAVFVHFFLNKRFNLASIFRKKSNNKIKKILSNRNYLGKEGIKRKNNANN